AGTYAVSEDASAAYTATFSGDGDANGNITLAPGDNKTVIITNNDVAALPAQPVLAVAKTADPPGGDPVSPGQTIEYRITYANSTATTVPAAALVDTLGPEVTLQPGTLVLNGTPIPDSGNYNAATRAINVALGAVPPGASGALVFRVTVGTLAVSGAGIENRASWTESGILAGTTPLVSHDVVSLDITKSVRNTSGTTVRTGSVLEWTIMVTNSGLLPVTNVVATDTVPSGTTYVRGSITGPGSDDSRAPSLRWNIGTLAAGESVELTLRSSVNSSVSNGTTVRNRAWVRSDQTPVEAATAAVVVRDTPTYAVRTSGSEDITLGLIGLLAMLSLGFAWSGRSRNPMGHARNRHITSALLFSAVMIIGGMEVGASYGLPLPSPGEAISSAIRPAEASDSSLKARAVASRRISSSVSIPAIGLNVRLVEGSSMSALANGVWRQPTSAKLGTAGASVIAGHRISSQFRRLPQLRVGDKVRVKVGGRTYTYRVASVSTQKAAGNKLRFRVGSKAKLILYTCVPKWQGDNRTVVVCYPVKK
ncbi:MAG: sortase, partial [Coriobacteriia bacterium]|nr:sortase [Coriobacteriia bacterium]